MEWIAGSSEHRSTWNLKWSRSFVPFYSYIYWNSRVDAAGIMALTLHYAAVITINFKQNRPCIFYCKLNNSEMPKNLVLSGSRYQNLLSMSNIPRNRSHNFIW